MKLNSKLSRPSVLTSLKMKSSIEAWFVEASRDEFITKPQCTAFVIYFYNKHTNSPPKLLANLKTNSFETHIRNSEFMLEIMSSRN